MLAIPRAQSSVSIPLTLLCWSIRDARSGLEILAVEDATLFLFFPNILPNTVLSDDFFRCGAAILDFEGTLIVDILGGLVRLVVLSSSGCAGTNVDESRWSPGTPTGLSIIFSRSGPIDALIERVGGSSPLAPNGIAIPVPGVRIGKSSSSIGIGFEIVFPRMDPVSARLGASAFHLPEARNLLIVSVPGRKIYSFQLPMYSEFKWRLWQES
jgi:hypothetical protein